MEHVSLRDHGCHLDAGLTADRELADNERVELEGLVALVPARCTHCGRAS